MKRFTETQKWEDPWFRRLSPELKLFWHWLLDKCDGAGIIEPDIELASFQIGFQYPADILSQFNERVTKLKCGKYFIPKFISYQYGTLSRECKAHNPIFASLEKHGLKGYPKGIHTLQEKEKEKDKVKETVQEQETVGENANSLPFDDPDFADAWSDWQQHRKEKKKPLTPTSIKMQLNALEDMGLDRAIKAIDFSIAQGYTGIFEPSQAPEKKKLKTPGIQL